MRQVYFYGSLPKEGESPFGGGEIGNMRTVNMLKNAGYSVHMIRRYKSKSNWNKIKTLMIYPWGLIYDFFTVFFTLLFGNRKSLVHLSGFAGVTIFIEFIVIHIIKTLRYTVIYELRGGGAESFYYTGSVFYKKMFESIVRNADMLFSQGKENIPFLNTICKTPVYHYVNCIEEDFAPTSCPNKPLDRIDLLFYGRLEENKHIDIIVDVATIIQKEVKNTYLTVVGNGQESYIQTILSKMDKALIPSSYKLLSGMQHKELPNLLREKHFYIFPSTQIREGQSNSVTECMSYGVVPIASPQGFNRSTIGNDDLIVEKLEPQSYADAILTIIRNHSFPYYSNLMYNRYKENYSQSIVFEKTLRVYDSIFNKLEINGNW